MVNKLTLLVVFNFFIAVDLFTQINANESKIDDKKSEVESWIFSTYLDQLEDLYRLKSVDKSEVGRIVSQYKKNNINSVQDFANNLALVYSRENGLAVLFYFFSQDTLRRYLLEPGKLIDEDIIPITETELITLREDIIKSLNIMKLSTYRAPLLRGIISPKDTSGIPSFSTAVSKATKLLIPSSFDEKYKHLLIIPALNIGIFPFHLLKPYQDDHYLIDKCGFTIAPTLHEAFSIRTRMLNNRDGFRIQRKNWNDENSELMKLDDYEHSFKSNLPFKNPLFVCNPKYPINEKYNFPNLPGTEKEIESIIKYCMDYTLLKDTLATKENILRLLYRHDVLYFATHGISSEDQPMENSFLVLSDPLPYLTAKEIIDLRNNSYKRFPELVILSACQTGLGKYLEAGIVGIARPFLINGANHVIMSLWNVDDEATAYLMSRFAYYLNSEEELHFFTPSEQLRLAILDTKEKYENPSFWASFTSFGVFY